MGRANHFLSLSSQGSNVDGIMSECSFLQLYGPGTHLQLGKLGVHFSK